MTREELNEVAISKYGIKNAADMSRDQLRKTIREIKEQDPNYVPKVAKTVSKPKLKQVPELANEPIVPSLNERAKLNPVSEPPIYGVHAIVYQDLNGEWRWNLKASNGRIVADSGEGYKTKWGCKRAARKYLGL